MTFYINFDKDGTRYHGIVEVRDGKMKCIDLCSWKYTPGGTPYSVDADLERHREDVETTCSWTIWTWTAPTTSTSKAMKASFPATSATCATR